jgi:hypothetical protein
MNKERKIMKTQKKRVLLFLSCLSISLVLFGCAQKAYRMHPQFDLAYKNYNILGLMLCDVNAYEITGLGVVELKKEWCRIGKKNLVSALTDGLRKKNYRIKPLAKDKEIEEEITEIKAVYGAVSKSIQLHTYGPQLFPEKMKNFVYSLGSVERILQKSGTDSLMFVRGIDHVLKGQEEAFISVAFVDSSGTILWYCEGGIRGEGGLRDPESASKLVENVLASFPETSG